MRDFFKDKKQLAQDFKERSEVQRDDDLCINRDIALKLSLMREKGILQKEREIIANDRKNFMEIEKLK